MDEGFLLVWLKKWSAELQAAGAVLALLAFVLTPLRRLPLWGWAMLKAISNWQRRSIEKWYATKGWALEQHSTPTNDVSIIRAYYYPAGFFRVVLRLFNGSALPVWFTFHSCPVVIEAWDFELRAYRIVGHGVFKPLQAYQVPRWTARVEADGQVDFDCADVLARAKAGEPTRLHFSLPVTCSVPATQTVSARFEILAYIDTDTKQ